MNYDIDSVSGIDKLRDRIANAKTIEEWSHILKDYIECGNRKISNTTAIFNMNSAHDCPNRESKSCQVPFSDCYAQKAESMYPHPLDYRRRQEYLWDCMTPELWASAFKSLNSRKRKPFNSIRFSEAGDFRHDGDIVRVNEIAKRVSIPVYTYSASNYLDWSLAKHFTVNASNDIQEYGNRRYKAVKGYTVHETNTVYCPNGLQSENGVPAEDRIKCGECKLCINPEGPDVAINIH